MLYMPGIFGEDLMDRWFDDMDRELCRQHEPQLLCGRGAHGRGYQSQTGARCPVAADPEEGSKAAAA